MLDNIKEYLSINLNDYASFEVNFEINKFILLCTLALCFAAFYVNHKRSLLSDTVKQLLRHNATSEDSARTLGELGLAGSRGIRKAIFNDSQLRRIIGIVGESRPSYEEYVEAVKKKERENSPDPYAMRLYIREDSLDRAKHVYNTYNASLAKTLLACVMFIAVAICLILLMPGLLALLDSALEM